MKWLIAASKAFICILSIVFSIIIHGMFSIMCDPNYSAGLIYAYRYFYWQIEIAILVSTIALIFRDKVFAFHYFVLLHVMLSNLGIIQIVGREYFKYKVHSIDSFYGPVPSDDMERPPEELDRS